MFICDIKAEYESLSQKCKNFAVDLLELCASADEIKVVLNEKYKDEDGDNNINNSCGESNCSLARVKLALKKEQKRVQKNKSDLLGHINDQSVSLVTVGTLDTRHYRCQTLDAIDINFLHSHMQLDDYFITTAR